MKKLFIVILCISLNIVSSQEFKPVNNNASDEAKTLLSYLYSINGKHLLSGQHSYNHEPDKHYDLAKDITGKYPAVWGTDFIWGGTNDPGEKIVADAIQKHKDGTIVTLMWHAGRPIDKPPFTWRESVQGKLTDQEWEELMTPGSKIHKTWLAQIDKVAEHLTKLRDAKVPILWRPYHEMNGVWFWWGNKKGINGYQKLWKMMYHRYVYHHKLNNLIWVWNANAPRDIPKDEAFPYKDFFPGHEYVDVLATDVYNFDYEQKDYEQLLELANNKLIALGEVGKLPKTSILDVQPKWAWFMVWSRWLITHNTEEGVKNIYNYQKTLTRDEVKIPN